MAEEGKGGPGKPGSMDRSLDEVSNVIHDLLSEPAYKDPDGAGGGQGGDGGAGGGPGGDAIPGGVVRSLLEPRDGGPRGGGHAYDEFLDERILTSRDAFGRKEMRIKVLEVSDEKAPTAWKLGDRVKVNRILVTVKHLESQEVEEGEFDIGEIERELASKRHYTSTNRWVPTTDIRNGYVAGSRHTSLISDAVALDYIAF